MAVTLVNRSVVGNMRSLTYLVESPDSETIDPIPVTFPCSVTAVSLEELDAVKTFINGTVLSFDAASAAKDIRVNIIGVGGG